MDLNKFSVKDEAFAEVVYMSGVLLVCGRVCTIQIQGCDMCRMRSLGCGVMMLVEGGRMVWVVMRVIL